MAQMQELNAKFVFLASSISSHGFPRAFYNHVTQYDISASANCRSYTLTSSDTLIRPRSQRIQYLQLCKSTTRAEIPWYYDINGCMLFCRCPPPPRVSPVSCSSSRLCDRPRWLVQSWNSASGAGLIKSVDYFLYTCISFLLTIQSWIPHSRSRNKAT